MKNKIFHYKVLILHVELLQIYMYKLICNKLNSKRDIKIDKNKQLYFDTLNIAFKISKCYC